MTEVRVAEDADEQSRIIAAWWVENRTSAPALFATELADVLALLATTPTIGVAYRRRGPMTIRRVLLPRSSYHVYFTYDSRADVVEVRAVWHAVRGSGPPLE